MPEDKKTPKKKNQIPVMGPSQNTTVDSLKMTNDEIERVKLSLKGKKYDPTVSNPKREVKLMNLVGNYLVPKVNEFREAADSTYDYEKAIDPEYKGVPAKKMDEVTKGQGARYIAHAKAYQAYRDIASPESIPNLKGTPLEKQAKPAAKFGGKIDYTKEDLYVPDRRMAKKPVVKKEEDVSVKLPEKKKKSSY